MNWLDRVRTYLNRIRGRLIVAFTFLGLGLVAMWWFGAASIDRYGEQVADQMQSLQQGSQIGTQLVHTILTQITAGEHYLVEGDSNSARRFEQLGFRAHDLRDRYGDVEGLAAEEQVDLARIGDLHSQLEVLYSIAHAQIDLGRRADAVATLSRAGDMLDELTGLVGELTRQEGDAIRAAAYQLQQSARDRQPILALLMLFVLGIGAIIVFATIRAVDQPLGRLVGAAHRFGEGDLNASVDASRMPTELAELAGAFGNMTQRLRAIVRETVSTAEEITASASDLSSISQEVAASSGEVSAAMEGITAGAEDQATGLRSVDDALDRIRTRSQEVDKNSVRVRGLSENIGELAAGRRQEVREAASTLIEVREVVQSSGREVFGLQDASDKISQFVETIQGIARQTDLLALNAAIEAARAGEHGRGFSVVAEEVRKLADGSARAADEVASTVRGIRAQIESVVGTMEDGTRQVAGVEEVARGVESAFESILESVEEVRDAAQRVTGAAEGNREAADDVERTVKAVGATAESHAASAEEVSAAAEEQSAATEEMSAASVELVRAAERLKKLVAGFRV